MQMSLFDGVKEFLFKKPVRLIEFFAGYGSQALALTELGVNFQHWKICEWAIKSIQAYKDNHFYDVERDYSQYFTADYIFNTLAEWGVSANSNEPLTLEQIKRLGEKECRKIYNNICITNNLVNISRVRAKDLQIEDTDIYDYVLTYSFPCQDLSKAGKGMGMEKGSGTRSGLLWEVERIIDECAVLGNLPKILLMENVPDVIGTKNIKHFAKWLEKLESLGYKCYWEVLNAKDYGIPQNRERCFMVSILGDCYYDFPEKQKLELRLKDLLEDEVDEKFYLSQKAIKGKLETKFRVTSFEGCLPQEDGCCRTLCARDYKDPKCVIIKGKECPITKENDNFIEWKQKGLLDSDCRTWKDNKFSGTLTCRGNNKILETEDLTTKNKRLASMIDKIDPTKCQAIDIYNQSVHDEMHTIKTNIDRANMTAITQNLRIRKLTPKECFRLMGVRDENFERIAKNQSNASLYHLAGDSIVVSVLVAILGQLVDGFNFDSYIDNFYEQMTNRG